jgi:hypothetical protein
VSVMRSPLGTRVLGQIALNIQRVSHLSTL